MKNWKAITGRETALAAECGTNGYCTVLYPATHKKVREHRMRGAGRGKSLLMFVLLAGMIGKICYSLEIASLAQTNEDMRLHGGILDFDHIDYSVPGYKEYMTAFEQRYPEKEIRAGAEDCVRYEEKDVAAEPVLYTDYEGMQGNSIYTGTDTMAEFLINVEEEGFYDLLMEYYPLAGNGTAIERSVLIDGQLPYRELGRVRYDRIWEMDSENGIRKDAGGHWREEDEAGIGREYGMTETAEWTVSNSYDGTGVFAEPLSLYLTKGEHTITLYSIREPMLLNQIILKNEKQVQEYADVKAFWDAVGIKETSGQEVRIEAEYAMRTSSQETYPVQNRTSPAASLVSGGRYPENGIDGKVWGDAGQWAEWEFDVKESGYYHISLYDCQNYVKDTGVCRKITIDGTVPFAELEDYNFTYGKNWREDVLSDGEGTPYVFYLKQGHHRIRMEAVLGSLSDIVSDVREEVWQVNEILSRIKDVIGAGQEVREGGKLAEVMPDLQEDINFVRGEINETAEKMQALAGRHYDGVKVMTAMGDQLEELAGDRGNISRDIRQLETSMYACSNWVDEAMCQPLAVDCVNIVSADMDTVYEKASVFGR